MKVSSCCKAKMVRHSITWIKLCSKCGSIQKDLKLSDRTFECECGNKMDRDYQASINLRKYGKLAS